MPNILQIYKICPIERPPAQPLQTGQTILYHAGDDGDLEEGIAKDYTILTTAQYSGTTDILINAKTHALSNNCVKDNMTDLMWARFVPLADIGPGNNGKLFWLDTTNNEEIWAFLSQVNANSLGGHNDWRIPNLDELLTLLNAGTNTPAIDTVVFPSTPSDEHWSSTTVNTLTTYAHTVSFDFGFTGALSKTLNPSYVRLVRG